MVRQISKAGSAVNSNKRLEPLNIIHLTLLCGYGFIAVLTPNLQAADSNGPKFLALALFNLMAFLYLFYRKDHITKSAWYFSFFGSGIGKLYLGLIVVSLLSFFKAYNLIESVLHFSKIFTTFSAAFLISLLIIADRRNIQYLCLAMTLLLIIDSFTVFAGIYGFIDGKVADIDRIVFGYSNKNILASSIFVKIPFGVWLLLYGRNWLKVAGILGILFAVTATLFMSTRAFYLGTIVFTILLIIFFFIRFRQSRDKYQLKLAGIFLVLVLFSFLIFSNTQRYLYPHQKGSGYDRNVKERLATITESDGGGGRLKIWNWSWQLFKQSPVIGVGLGNWKVETPRIENQTSPDFFYAYKAHNDFIEIATETGFLGGLFFLGIFLLAGIRFVIVLFKNPESDYLALLFLPVSGLVCYSFDAFFNFPQDRPEIQALFALYIGALTNISFQYHSKSEGIQSENVLEKWMGKIDLNRYIDNYLFKNQTLPKGKKIESSASLKIIKIFGILVLAVIAYILYLNFVSLKLQRIGLDDKNLKQKADLFVTKYPVIPSLGVFGEPIANQKAIYLINEKREEEALKFLKMDVSSPFDSRREYYIARAYNNMGMVDSSILYLEKASLIKPFFFNNISLLMNLYRDKGLEKDNEFLLDNYLSRIKNNREAWLFTTSYFEKSGNILKAKAVTDSAAHYFPSDSLVLNQNKIIHRRAMIYPYTALYDSSAKVFNSGRFSEAIRIYNELLSKKPNLTELLHFRAYSYYQIKEYAKSNQDLNYLILNGTTSSSIFSLYNLRGSNFYMLGNLDEACKNFKIAADKGEKNGQDNYAKLCNSRN